MAFSWTKHSLVGAFVALSLVACGDDSESSTGNDIGKNNSENDAGIVAITEKTISGVSQKGPFVNGSSVTVQELDGETLSQTGGSFEGKIKNDLGEFSVKVKKLESQYALLKANGFYRNEVTGKKSKSQVTLYALTDLSNRDEVNVNLLTHLAYERSLYLAAEETLSVAKAKKQAEAEVLKSFGIEGDFDAAEDLNIFGEDDQSAALLAVSVLMQGELSEADFSERLANYAADIETDGVWDDSKTAAAIADWASDLGLGGGLENIRNNIANWDISAGVPNFEKYVNRFWWQNYGLGICGKKRKGEVLTATSELSQNNGSYFICEDGAWREATDLEKDTYGWKAGKDGDVKSGDVDKKNCYVFENSLWRSGNASDCSLKLRGCTKSRQDTVGLGSDKVWYICDERSWREATDIEKDTYKWKAGKDGDVKSGDVDKKNCYVFEDSLWRSGNAKDCSLKLRGCTVLRQDTVGLGSDKVWYICDERSWREATDLEKDTYGWKDSTDGAIKKGDVTGKVYVFDKNEWQLAGSVESKLGGCVEAIIDSVGKIDRTYYICKSGNWLEATPLEYDTYHWAAGNDGDSKIGDVNGENCYVYENKAWRNGNAKDCSLKLRGCTTLRQATVGLGSDKIWYICDKQDWRNAKNIEKDTATWGAGAFDGEVRAGQINKTLYYIYEADKKLWRNATTLEKDTYDYANNKDWADGEEGETKKGAITDTVYVFESSAWRIPNEMETEYGFCTDEIQDSSVIAGDWWHGQRAIYVCHNRQWRIVSVETDQSCAELDNGFVFYYNCNSYFHISDLCEGWSDYGGTYYMGTMFICSNGVWKTARDDIYLLEKCNAQRESEIVIKKVGTDIWGATYYYACQDGLWNKVSSLEYEYGLCTEERANDTASANGYYYVCKNKKWTSVTMAEYLYGPCTKEKENNLSEGYYVCQNEEWKSIKKNVYLMELNVPRESIFNDNITYGTLLDERDGRSYRTVMIGGREWMAENLNYLGCDSYFGCSYSWDAAMNVGKECDSILCEISEPHQGVCPDGWHIPSGSEWEQLFADVGGNNFAMMSSAAWKSETTDDYGFSIIPVPLFWDEFEDRYPSQSFHWSSSQYDKDEAMQWYVSDGISEGENKAELGHNPKEYEFYVRCVKDEE